jgi:hypothetical protein
MNNRSPLARACLAACLLTPLALAACSGDELSRNFGLTRDAPDEFQVTTRAPLSMPPDFSLRPPRPGASRPQELSQQQQAEAALVPDAALNPPGRSANSPGQQALISAAGKPAPADIRAKVDNETALDAPSRTLVDRLMFWKPAPPPGTAVDATREAARLRENAALGQSPEAGDTPIIQPKKQGFLDTLF